MKNILITGVSSGIGYGTTKAFIEKGYRVFGSVRKEADAKRLKIEFGENYIPVLLDVTDQDSIRTAAEVVKNVIGDQGLHGLINNAGATNSSPLMHVPIETFKRNLEVLLVGQLAVTQAFLPLLGAQKNYKNEPGRIINIGSIYGKLYAPFVGNYTTAKHAMEGFTRTLRLELRLYGIKVINVAPGIIKTPIWDKNSYDAFDDYKDTDFYPAYNRYYPLVQKLIEEEGYELDVFCQKLCRIFEKKSPRFRYAVVKGKFKNWTIQRMMPDKVTDVVLGKMVGL